MNDKPDLLASLRAVFDDWENLLAGKTEEDITAQRFSAGWSIKDVIAHLRAWQQISIARLEAALLNTQPEYPTWLGGADPFYAEDHTGEFNDRIYKIYHDQSWSSVHQTWREGFLHFMELGKAIPEKEMHDTQKYPWLKGYALSAVLQGSSEHHREHLDSLSAGAPSTMA